MPEIKDIIALSNWITFELETKLFKPPIIKLRISPIAEDVPIIELMGRKKFASKGEVWAYKIFDIVQDWDFTDEGEKVPLTRDNKRKALTPLLGLKLKGEKQILGTRIVEMALDPKTFVKN